MSISFHERERNNQEIISKMISEKFLLKEKLRHSDLRNTDFSSITLRNTSFRCSDLRGSTFQNTYLLSCNLNNTNLLGISLEKVRGVRVTFEEWTVSFSPDGKSFASGGSDSQIKIWDNRTFRMINSLEKHKGRVWSVAHSPSSQLIVSSGNDCQLILWNQDEPRTLKHHRSAITKVAFSKDGSLLASCDTSGCIDVYNTESWQATHFISLNVVIESVCFTPNNQYVVAACWDNFVAIIELSTQIVRKLIGHKTQALSASVSDDGKFVVSGSHNRDIVVWDFETGNILKSLKGHEDWVTEVGISSNMEYIVSVGVDRRAIVWDFKTGNIIMQLYPHRNIVESLAISPDNKYILTACHDSKVRLFKMIPPRIFLVKPPF